jgi:hypothetical protein
MSDTANRRITKSCLFIGCLGASVMALLLAGLGYFAYKGFERQFLSFTSESPMPVPIQELSPERYQEVKARTDAFMSSLNTNGAPHRMVLSEEELNGLLAKSEFRGRIYLQLEEGVMQARVSMPVDLPMFPKRYINATGEVVVEVKNGNPLIMVRSAEFNGNPLPEAELQQLANQNLAGEMSKNPDFGRFIKKIQLLEIQPNQVTITTGGREETAPLEQPAKP